MKTAYLALGSNLGDRLQNLRFAVTQLEKHGVFVAAKSRIYESQSVGTGGKGDFLNAVLRAKTTLDAPEFLALCQSVEIAVGREAASFGEHRVGPRTLDVDILLFGEENWNLQNLSIPHPRALHRNFVLAPLLDVLEGGDLRATELKF